MNYEFVGYEDSKIVRLDILINWEKIEAFSMVVHESKAYQVWKEICEKLSDIEEVLEVITLNNYPIVDEYGEVNDEVALKVEMTRESLDEIRWENFEHENLKDVADEYFENPKLENKK